MQDFWPYPSLHAAQPRDRPVLAPVWISIRLGGSRLIQPTTEAELTWRWMS